MRTLGRDHHEARLSTRGSAGLEQKSTRLLVLGQSRVRDRDPAQPPVFGVEQCELAEVTVECFASHRKARGAQRMRKAVCNLGSCGMRCRGFRTFVDQRGATAAGGDPLFWYPMSDDVARESRRRAFFVGDGVIHRRVLKRTRPGADRVENGKDFPAIFLRTFLLRRECGESYRSRDQPRRASHPRMIKEAGGRKTRSASTEWRSPCAGAREIYRGSRRARAGVTASTPSLRSRVRARRRGLEKR